MQRRNFLRAMLGVAAATALPSEVWPFRKIFLPAMHHQHIVQILQSEFDATMEEFRRNLDAALLVADGTGTIFQDTGGIYAVYGAGIIQLSKRIPVKTIEWMDGIRA